MQQLHICPPEGNQELMPQTAARDKCWRNLFMFSVSETFKKY